MVTIQELLTVSHNLGASDLHITAGLPPKCRVNGDVVDMGFPILQPKDTEVLVTEFMNEKFKKEVEETGQSDFSYSFSDFGRYRVNVFKQRGSYAAAIRLIGTQIPNPEQLGLSTSVVQLTNKKRGLVLVTGPTGSGKSTTLASLINVINQGYARHVITLEDPIEYLHQHNRSIVNQREVGSDTNSFGNGLRAALREDPDVILVGEMRDNDTIATAITAAETGHLVFSTLHTIGAASTIDRIIDVFPPHQQQQIRIQLASVIEAVISQQLLPTADGRGRVGAFEVMHANPAIRNLIRENKSHQISTIIQTNKKLGMQTMDDALYELYLKRIITADKAIAFAQDSLALQRKMF